MEKSTDDVRHLGLDTPMYAIPSLNIEIRTLVQLRQSGIKTLRELLYNFPRAYSTTVPKQIKEAQSGETVCVLGTVQSHTILDSPKKAALTIQRWVVQDNSGTVESSQFFNHSYQKSAVWRTAQHQKYGYGTRVLITGRVKVDQWGKKLEKPEVQVVSLDFKLSPKHRITPIYSESEGLKISDLKAAIAAVRDWLAVNPIQCPLPPELLKCWEVMDLTSALCGVHQPQTSKELENARTRLAFDELLYLQLALLKRRQDRQKTQIAGAQISHQTVVAQFLKNLTFQLTAAQRRVANEILNDLSQPVAMNRLVQGDVGSGKTVVAVVALLSAIGSGYQTALMAPTGVLAQQHYEKIREWLQPLGIEVALLTGSTKERDRKVIQENLRSGTLTLVVGTHALVQNRIEFKNLGLCVIDEQHRFGVEQRDALSAKGQAVHVLSMTATPIPRTLALTLHGELEISVIDELPPGRTPIKTQIAANAGMVKTLTAELTAGRQAYIVYPLVEESEKLDLQAATTGYETITNQFPQWKVGLCHGKLRDQDKAEAITQFRDNRTQILVSTVVIEVGIDVPNATVMVIENAERFGLAQLHQLRGRVGRGSAQSYCFLKPQTKSAKAMTRLRAVESSNDGNLIAEIDLQLRGAGEILGKRQAGIENFTIARLPQDIELLELARLRAKRMILEGMPGGILEELSIRHPV